MNFIKKIFSNSSGIIGAVLVLLFIIVATAAPLIAPYDPVKMHPADSLRSPDSTYWAGTDQFGRDIFSRLVYGARISLFVAVTSILISASVGGLLGTVLGYVGGNLDIIGMRFVDMMMAFPSLIMALIMVVFLGNSIQNIIIAITIAFTPVFIRIVRGSAITLKKKEFCLAAKASGAGTSWIIYYHIMPNIFPLLLTQSTLSFSKAIMFESALSFLGLGVQPPIPSWGGMIGTGRQFMSLAPWVVIAPGLGISIIVIGLNLLGDRLRDITDPYLRGRK